MAMNATAENAAENATAENVAGPMADTNELAGFTIPRLGMGTMSLAIE